MIFEHQNYRAYLRTVLVNRIARNPAYSLRCLALELAVSPSLLSMVIKGQKNFSQTRARAIGQRLELSGPEIDYFCALVEHQTAKSELAKSQCVEKIRKLNRSTGVQDLSTDYFQLISDWYHIPILVMTDLTGFKFTKENVAKKIGLTVLEAETAIERLLRLQLLEITPDGNYRRVHENALFQSEKPHPGLQHFHRQMLNLAIRSLETQNNREKVVGSQTFAVDSADLPRARKLIEDFLNAMSVLFSEGTKRSQIYHLGIQLFNLRTGGKSK